jgi:hypothetical protein
MMPRSTRPKLPVPGPWQAPVRAAMAHLSARRGVPGESVAPARVEEAAWRGPGGETVHGLEIWLVAGGATWRYRAAGEAFVPEPVDAPRSP